MVIVYCYNCNEERKQKDCILTEDKGYLCFECLAKRRDVEKRRELIANMVQCKACNPNLCHNDYLKCIKIEKQQGLEKYLSKTRFKRLDDFIYLKNKEIEV